MKPGHHQRSSYGSESSFVPRLLPRIPVSSQFLLEFLHAVYFAMYVMHFVNLITFLTLISSYRSSYRLLQLTHRFRQDIVFQLIC